MKRFFIALFVAFLSVTNATAEEIVVASGEQKISGYGVGEFAVKGEIAGQVKILIARIKNAQPDSTELAITIIGSADNQGASAENDRLSKERAEAVAGVLSYSFPKTKINIVPAGDEENCRQVVVKYEFIRVVPDENLAEIKSQLDSLSENKEALEAIGELREKIGTIEIEKENKNYFSRGEIILAVVLSLVFLFAFYVIIIEPRLGRESVSASEVSKSEEEIRVNITDKDGQRYSAQVIHKKRVVGKKSEEIFVSPFVSESGKNIEEANQRDIEHSIRRCIERPEKFPRQFDALCQSGKVKKVVES
jgi:hypothetical protein